MVYWLERSISSHLLERYVVEISILADSIVTYSGIYEDRVFIESELNVSFGYVVKSIVIRKIGTERVVVSYVIDHLESAFKLVYSCGIIVIIEHERPTLTPEFVTFVTFLRKILEISVELCALIISGYHRNCKGASRRSPTDLFGKKRKTPRLSPRCFGAD